MDVKAEAEPVPIENRAEDFIEVGEVQIIWHGHDSDHHRTHIAQNRS